jgi:hypothetical protein
VHRALAASALAVVLALAACDADVGTPSPASSVAGAAPGTAAVSPPGSAPVSGPAVPSDPEETTAAGPSGPASGGRSAGPSPSAESASSPVTSSPPAPAASAAPSASAAPASPAPSPVRSTAPAREYQAPEDLEAGQCYSPILDEDDDFLLAAILRRCDEPHRAEVVGIERLPGNAGTPYPGDDRIDQQAEAACDEAFEAYVGIPYDESRLRAVFYAPTERTWPGGDRRVTCVVESEARALTATVRGTRR